MIHVNLNGDLHVNGDHSGAELNVILDNILQDECNQVGHGVIPGQRRRKAIEDK